MTDQTAEANRNAQQAAGPPPDEHALKHSGLVDQPVGYLRNILARITGFVVGGSARDKQS